MVTTTAFQCICQQSQIFNHIYIYIYIYIYISKVVRTGGPSLSWFLRFRLFRFLMCLIHEAIIYSIWWACMWMIWRRSSLPNFALLRRLSCKHVSSLAVPGRVYALSSLSLRSREESSFALNLLVFLGFLALVFGVAGRLSLFTKDGIKLSRESSPAPKVI